MTVAGSPVPLGTPKQRAVLAVLLINRNRAVAAESLMDAAWDEDPVPAARASLHTYVSNLRRLLAIGGANPQTMLAAVPPGYRLSVPEGDCDLDRFSAQKYAGIHAAAAGHFEQASQHLLAAMAEWRGFVLDDLRDFAFVEPFATALIEDMILVQTTRAQAEIACGRAYSVIANLEALASEHPYREPVWTQLMTAYYLAERQSDALNAYRRLKTVLAEDLGIDPGPAISTLYERILRQERLDVKRTAKTTAIDAARTMLPILGCPSAPAHLRDAAGVRYPLASTITRIGRLADNDIVLEDVQVSRHHAVIIDTGSSFVITDARSANGVEVQGQPLSPSAALADGDHIRICGYDFTFEVQH
jgi:DNA-binding SARP family transcriptional activator